MQIKSFFTKEKFHALYIHLGISVFIFLVILYFILFEWYPEPLFSTDGGWQGIQIIAFVDIVLGPVLTFVIYKKGKKRLKVDLSIIAAIQFAALFSGVFVVYNEHPVAIIIMNNRLHPVTVSQVKEAKIEISSLQQFSDFFPPIIYSNLPTDAVTLELASRESLHKGIGLRLFSKYYEKLSILNKPTLISNSMLLESYIEDNPNYVAIYNQFLKRNQEKLFNLIYLPLYSRYEYGVAVLDKDTFAIVEVLDIFPPRMGDNYTSLGDR